MYSVIETKALKATDTKGERIQATDLSTNKRVVIGYDYSVSAWSNHVNAAITLATELGLKADATQYKATTTRGYRWEVPVKA